MVSVLDSGSSCLGLSLGGDTALFFYERHFTLIVPLLNQVYKWVPVNLLLLSLFRGPGGGGGGVEILLVCFML